MELGVFQNIRRGNINRADERFARSIRWLATRDLAGVANRSDIADLFDVA